MQSQEFNYNYDGQMIPCRVWYSDYSDEVERIIFLGSVQIGMLPKWVAEQSPPKTAVIQGAPHWHAKHDGSDIPEYMSEYSVTAFRALLRARTVKPSLIIAESQAAPGVIMLFARSEYSSYMKSMALIQPLGLTEPIFRGSDRERIELFRYKIIQNGYYQLASILTDTRLRYNYRMLTKHTSLKDPKSAAQYNSGLKNDSLPVLKELLKINRNVTIVCGGRDKIFPETEITNNLKDHGIDIEVVKVENVPHSPLASKQGIKLLEKAFDLLSSQ